jgi:hypothetical protein
MAPQVWQGRVAHRVGVVSFRVAWLVWALHLGHIRGYVCGGGGIVMFGVGAFMPRMVRSGFVRESFRGVHCGVPFRFGVPGLSCSVPARSFARALGVMLVRRDTRASWIAMCSSGVRHKLAAMHGTWRVTARWRRRIVGLLEGRKGGMSCGFM